MTKFGFSIRLTLGLLIVLSFPLTGKAATDLATITGRVHDSTGTPLTGALVVVVPSSPVIPERIAFTDKWGSFSVMNLFAGDYSVKVTMPRFLPALKPGIRLTAGGSMMLTVNLQNALDIVRRATSRSKEQSDDIVWTLRSSRATEPILRAVEPDRQEPSVKRPVASPNYSGYFQVYSKSLETSSGTTEGVGSQFSLTMPLDPTSQVTLAGQYSEAPMQPRGFGATYEFVPADRHKATLGLNVRDGALFGDAFTGQRNPDEIPRGFPMDRPLRIQLRRGTRPHRDPFGTGVFASQIRYFLGPRGADDCGARKLVSGAHGGGRSGSRERVF